jgi:hypothetical protein
MSPERSQIPQSMIDTMHRHNPGRPDVVEQTLDLQDLVGEEKMLGVYGVMAAKGEITMMVDEMPTDELTTEYQEMLRSAVSPDIPVSFLATGEPNLLDEHPRTGSVQSPSRRPTIQELSARQTRVSSSELVPPEEAKERALQRTFVEVLAHAGLPFETAFQLADAAYEIHRAQQDGIEILPRDNTPKEPTPEEIARREAWERMTPEEHEAEGRRIWAEIEANPDAVEGIKRGMEDFEQGRYFSMAVLEYEMAHPNSIPKIQVAEGRTVFEAKE